MKKLYLPFLLVLLLGILTGFEATSQQVIPSPDDTLILYNPNNLPQRPPSGTVGLWVHTSRMNWNTSQWKAYYYNGMAFRLIFPKTYKTDPPGTKYPLLVFFHGAGEAGSIYDNELQLAHCANKVQSEINSGDFNGFALFPQSTNRSWFNGPISNVGGLIQYLIDKIGVDKNRVIASGLSGGGEATWVFADMFPKLTAGVVVMSASTAAQADPDFISKMQDIPIWLSQGGKDGQPTQNVTDYVVHQFQNAGIDIRQVTQGLEGYGPKSEGFYLLYPNMAHNTWDAMYNEPLLFPNMLRAYKSNPHVYFGKREFCPGDNINVKLELTPGFAAYEWRKNDVIIAGANSNTITVTDTGTYSARIKNGDDWSQWSPWPAQITYKETTNTPPIRVFGLMSKVIPAPDGNASVKLVLPPGYESYEWRNAAGQVLGTDSIYSASTPGNYTATVTEINGCSAVASVPFYVASSTGPNPPAPATNLSGYALSQTGIQLNWSNDLNPTQNETAFEIYRATKSGGPYTLAGINPADSLSFIDKNLNANTEYFYVIRSVDSTSSAAISDEDSIMTLVDREAPTAPTNLSVLESTDNSVTLQWNASTDNASVKSYYIYINGQKSYVSSDTTFTVYTLTHGKSYTFYVTASDPTGNVSVASNQVVGSAAFQGLTYKYYTYTGSWSQLPDLGSLTPVDNGQADNITLDPASQSTNYALSFQGFINIRKAGTYTFYTSSDDGSMLYINNTTVVSNNGLHGTIEKSGDYTFTQPGMYPIKVDYYQEGGGAVLAVSWKATSLNIPKSIIPDSAFHETVSPLGDVPAIPTNIAAHALSYDSVKVAWSDQSNNETGFEVYRATIAGGPFQIIATTASNISSIIDTTVKASTTYYYKVQAINQNGSSGFDPASIGGLNYAYYEASSLSSMPDFGSLSPTKSGSVPNITLDVKERTTQYALKFEGTIDIQVAGQYTFYTKSDDGSNLYIDGFDDNHKVVNNSYLQGPTERSGDITLSAGIHLIYITFFQQAGGDYLTASYKGPGINKIALPDAIFANAQSITTTPDLPQVPISPSNLVATATSASTIGLTWADGSNDETEFDIYRSDGNNTSYRLLKKVAAESTFYSDSGLFSNTLYYYKVEASNIGGSSEFSNESSTTTLNQVPQMNKLKNTTIRYGETATLGLMATDKDNEPLTFTAQNLPSFAALDDYHDGTGLITFSPTQSQEGSYPNIKLKVTDQHGGSDSSIFTLTVNGDYPAPTISAPGSYNLPASSNTIETITANYGNQDDELIWQINNSPSFVTYQVEENGRKLLLSINPGAADFGSYTLNLTVTNSDGTLSNSQNINLLIRKLQSIYVNFNDGTNSQGGIWNNTNVMYPNINTLFANLMDFNGSQTPIGLKILTPWQNMGGGSNNSGTSTGNNSGVYPDNVMKSAYWTNNTASQSIQVYGLDPTHIYNFTFFGSRSGSGNRTSVYQIGSQTVSQNASSNTTDTVTINDVSPDSEGTITVTLSAGAGSTYGYLNAMVITGDFQPNGVAPIAPENLTASYDTSGNFVRLNWEDHSDNETGFNIYRKISDSINYEKIATVNENITVFNDSAAIGSTENQYEVRAYNGFGNSAFIGPVNISIPNTPPVIEPIENLSINQGSTDMVQIVALTSPGNTITLSVQDLPSFAQFTDSLNGHGTIVISPSESDHGNYSFIVTATDNKGASSSKQVMLQIVSLRKSAIYINFNDGTNSEGGKWNNTNVKYPDLNDTFTPLIDTTGYTTSVGLKIVTPWQNMGGGSNNSGTSTGNNSGVYPDNVMKSAYWTNNTASESLQVYGLDPSHVYNFTFFGSRSGTGNRTSVYQIGTQMVSQNASNNTTSTISIDNIAPDAAGTINVTLSTGSGSTYAYLNAMIISGDFLPNGTAPIAPSELTASYDNENHYVKLIWNDQSDNETGFDIFRKANDSTTYKKIKTVASNITTVNDSALVGLTEYQYQVRAYNEFGSSPFVGPVEITTPNTPPVIQPIGNININEGDTKKVDIITATAPENEITLSVQNLPSFAQFTDSTNGRGSILMSPSDNSEGDYIITVTATDDKGGSSSTQMSIHVSNPNSYHIFVNFNGSLDVSAPWNNTSVTTPTSGTTISNLINSKGVATNASLSFSDSWSGSVASGTVTGNNSGIYPDNVMQTAYWDKTGIPKHIVLSGLSTTLTYTINMFASRPGTNFGYTVYSADGMSDSVNVSNNTTEVAKLLDIRPDANGKITIVINRGSGATNAYLNAMEVYAHDSSEVITPVNLKAISNSADKINLTWQNSSRNLNGTEIWRSLSANGTFSKIATASGNSDSYQDMTLNPNTKYFYKIRAIRNGHESPFSIVANATTILYSVYISFGDDNLASLPWNNLSTVPLEGNQFDLSDASDYNTGIVLTDMGGFSAVNHSGTSTGDNSGVYPDYVMYRSYFVDGVDTGKLSLSGLNLSMSYNLTFFAGRTGTGNRTTVYIAGGKSDSLNASDNTTQTVTLTDISPDESGKINISVTAGRGSSFGYIGALVIQAHNNYDDSGNIKYDLSEYMNNRMDLFSAPQIGMKPRGKELNTPVLSVKRAYPNPFASYVMIEMSSPKDDKYTFNLYQMNGGLVDMQVINMGMGLNNIKYQPRTALSPNMYILSIRSNTTGKMMVVKLIKQ